MKIVIAGGSGFVGKKLSEHLIDKGHDVFILSRHKEASKDQLNYIQWLREDAKPEDEIGYADVFINLAGVSINHGRWTQKHQKQIYDSRMDATDELLRMINAMTKKPKILVNASAIGIYPASESARYTETSTELANDFLGTTVRDWELKAMRAEHMGIRVVCTRFGVILGKDGGALSPIVTPYKLFAGGTVGSGKQWLSWVHIEDVVRAIEFAIETKRLSGPVNIVSPFPKQMKYFGQAIGSTLHRPHWLPAPAFMMRLLLGKKSDLVLKGQFVVPEKLQENGFSFSYPTLEEALKNLLT